MVQFHYLDFGVLMLYYDSHYLSVGEIDIWAGFRIWHTQGKKSWELKIQSTSLGSVNPLEYSAPLISKEILEPASIFRFLFSLLPK